MARVNFFAEDIDFAVPSPRKLSSWIQKAIEKEGFSTKELNYIFCSDTYLLNINQQYLAHNTLTDIITFDNSEEDGEVEGDIFISIDRVRENAEKFKTSFFNELCRVVIHGALHLAGYTDKSKDEKELMREKEEAYLSLLKKRST